MVRCERVVVFIDVFRSGKVCIEGFGLWILTCGLNEPADGGVKFVQCAGCRRTRYCTRECQKIDWKKHRVLCEAIVAQNKRVSAEIKELIKTGKSEAVNNALIEAATGGSFLVIKKLFKNRGDDIDVNAVNSVGVTALYIVHAFFSPNYYLNHNFLTNDRLYYIFCRYNGKVVARHRE